MKINYKAIPLAALLLCAGAAQAFTFKGESVSGSFDSTISTGVGIRMQNPLCSHIIGSFGGSFASAQPTGEGAPVGCADVFSGYNDQGNLNYKKHDAFTTYVKGVHELLLNYPEEIKFLGRVSWLHDFTSIHATGYLSGLGSQGSFPDNAQPDIHHKERLLDFWVSKSFSIGEERARVRVGNQVVSWGESLFIPGGINQTNTLDFMRLSQPGTQLKEAILPAPIVDFATGLGHGFNMEAYVQQGWSPHYFPPVGSYWSTASIGRGADTYGLPTPKEAKSSGQGGLSLRYQPDGMPLNLGVYFMNYHDKGPVLSTSTTSGSGFQYSYLENRKMYGVSANFPLGNWAIGAELSYRPRDAVSLNTSAPGLAENSLTPVFGVTSCLADGKCYVEEKRYQLHLTGLLSLVPSDHGGFLKLVGADTGTLLAEAVVVRYPNLKSTYQGVPVAAGYWGWGFDTTQAADATGMGSPAAVGDKTSWGYNFDFSLVYDGSVVPGWQMIPGVYFFHAVKGRTPNAMATFMKGAKVANFYLNFVQNPATWQIGMNYAKYWGDNLFDQPLKDRSFFGLNASRNF